MKPAFRVSHAFGALVLAQAAHSTEETLGQLSIIQRGYTPGVITAPILFLLALYLGRLQIARR